MPQLLLHDIETRSALDIRNVSTYQYARHPTTDVWCVAYSVNGASPELWSPGQPIPSEFITAATDPDWCTVAFNDQFERLILEYILAPRYGWPRIPIERRRCVQAAALARALPASLDRLTEALPVVHHKSEDNRWVNRMARPRPPRKGEAPGLYWHDDPASLTRHYEYCRQDVRALAEIVSLIGLLPPDEQAVWEMDARINTRGVHVDRELLEASCRLSARIGETIRDEIVTLTGGEVPSIGSPKFLAWCNAHGCELTDIRKPTIATALANEDHLSPQIRQALELRAQGASIAATKHETLRDWLEANNRVRGAFRYHGAGTGRFTSYGPQLHNLKKPTSALDPTTIGIIRSGDYTELRKRCRNPLATIGEASRALITAAPGHRLYIADFSGIESRGAAWLCNETTKVAEWAAFDRSGKPEDDPYYKLGKEVLLLLPETARTIGKTADLAFAYGGGIGAYRKFDQTTPDVQVKTYLNRWKKAHRNIVRFWDQALVQACKAHHNHNTGQTFPCQRVSYISGSNSLFTVLPSGRKLAYPDVQMFTDPRYGTRSFTFMENTHGKWWRYGAGKRGVTGGHLLENATQAVCRDVFVAAMLRLEAAGYPIVLHVHDEIVCEVPIGHGSEEEFHRLMVTPPDWADGLPIAAKLRVADCFIEFKGNGDRLPEPKLDDEPEEEDDGDGGQVIEVLPLPPPPPSKPQPPRLHVHEQATLPLKPPPPLETAIREDLPPRANGNGRSTWSQPEGYACGEQNTGSTTATYIYRHVDGTPYMKVRRTSTKQFPTYAWDRTTQRWVSGRPSPLIPYRLDELVRAPAVAPVWVAEGEKDADRLASLGLLVTTNPGGASKPGQKTKWAPELTKWLKGRQLAYVLEDNDDAGRNHAAQVAKALRTVGVETVIISFPELAEKGDVSDWFDQGGTLKALWARAEIARQRQKSSGGYRLINLATVPLEAQDWLWEGHLLCGGLEIISGLPGLGKSQVQCQLIASATSGRAWPDGQTGPTPGRVVILTAEDTSKDYRRRLQGVAADMSKVEMLDSIHRNDRDEMFLLSEDLDKLDAILRDLGDVILVAFDPITAFMGSGRGFDSHRATDVRSQLGPLRMLAEKHNIAFSVVTHPSKNPSQRAIDHFLGSQAFIAAARVGHLCVAEMETVGENRQRATGRVFFTHPKHSHSAEMPTLVYQLKQVPIGWDEARDKTVTVSVAQFEGTADITADEAVAASRPSKGRDRDAIKDFLLDILANGPVPQATVVERAAVHGFSPDQLKRARSGLGAVAFKPRGGGLNSGWMWALPQHAPGQGGANMRHTRAHTRCESGEGG
jgi:DNA polymerase